MKAPPDLRPATKRWVLEVSRVYILESHHERLLLAAARAWDQLEAASATLARDGMFFVDKAGQPKAHPAVAVCRDSAATYRQLLRELDLDVVAPTEPSRPPLLPQNKRNGCQSDA